MTSAGAAPGGAVAVSARMLSFIPPPDPRLAARLSPGLDYPSSRPSKQSREGGPSVRLRPLQLQLWFLVPALLLAAAPAWAKGTGYLFVSNEKTNNIIVLDPKSYQIVKDLKTSRRPRDMHFN